MGALEIVDDNLERKTQDWETVMRIRSALASGDLAMLDGVNPEASFGLRGKGIRDEAREYPVLGSVPGETFRVADLQPVVALRSTGELALYGLRVLSRAMEASRIITNNTLAPAFEVKPQ